MTDVMRRKYKELNSAEKAEMQEIKELGEQFHTILGDLGDTREISLAKTKVEEAVMWAVKHITQ